MKYVKQQNLHERKVQDRQLVIKNDGSIELTPLSGEVRVNGNLRVTGESSGPTNSLVYYVSLEGDDANDGLGSGPDRAKRSVKSAVEAAPVGATIQLAPGDYYEDNPITMKERQTVRGDSLRNTQIWPLNNQDDIFFVDNACYIFQVSFRGLRDPGWCVRIKPGALVTTSPYVQNCSNLNGPWLNDGTEFIPFETVQIEGIQPGARPIINNENVPLAKRVNETGGGNGMLVDGNEYDQRSLVFSMVADAFTQIAQGGIGFHITNFGYTQIVSCFTVFNRIGFLATNGGYLSISNSVSDFGTFAIVADGLFDEIYTTARPTQNFYSNVGSVTVNNQGAGYITTPTVVIDPPTTPGGVQATAIASLDPTTGKVTSVSVNNQGSGYDFIPNITFTGGGFTSAATATVNLVKNTVIEVNSLRDRPQVGSIITFEGDSTKYYIIETDVSVQPFIYDESICRRDVRRIVDAVLGDMTMGTNYQSLAAARSYLRSTSAIVLQQQLEPTIFGIEAARDEMLAIIPDSDPANEDARYDIIELFSLITNVLEQGDSTAAPDIIFNDLAGIDSGFINAKNRIIANRDFIVEEVTKYIAEQFTNLSYDQDKCERDVRLITTAVAYDVGLGTNYNSVTAGKAYARANASEVLGRQKDITLDSFTYLKSLILAIPSVSGNATALSRATTAMDEILEIIAQGDSTSADDLTFSVPTGGVSTRTNAHNQLRQNRTFIQAEIIAWIANDAPTLSYDEFACERDVGYIVDALSYDILYGGNSGTRTSADAYFVGTISQLGSGESAITIRAYERLQVICERIIQGQNVVKTVGNAETQITSGGNGSGVEAERSTELIQIIIDVIAAGSTANAEEYEYPSVAWASSALQSASAGILATKDTNATSVTAYILTTYPSFTYDREKCKRDVGLIIDAVNRDIKLGTNHNSIVAGQAYRRATAATVDAEQFPATVLSIRYLQSLCEESVADNATALERCTDRFEIILDVVEYGALPSEGTTYPSPTPASQELIDSARLLQDNKNFLIEETIAYVNFTYPSLVYDEAKCRRDTGYIIDSVTHDLLYTGNRSVLVTARSYYDDGASTIVGQEAETADAIEHLRDVSSSVIEGIAVIPTAGNTETQVITGTFGSSVESTISEEKYDIIIDAITGGLITTPSNQDPDYTWLLTDLKEAADTLLTNNTTFQQDVIDYITNNLLGFSYNVEKCERDTSYIIDAAVYDAMYGGNKQTRRAAEAYYNGVILGSAVVGTTDQADVTEFTYKHLANVLSSVAQNIAITPSEGVTLTQNTSGTAGSSTAGTYVSTMVNKIADVVRFGNSALPFEIDHSYDTIGDVTLNSKRLTILANLDDIEDESIRLLNLEYGGVAELTIFPGLLAVTEGTLGSMQNVSTISTSGHAYEYVGAGITYNALPFFGGSPIAENEFIESNSGKVFSTSTDQIGNFRVGNFFNVNALTGAITLNANEINLSGIASIGPFRRFGIPVGVELKEVSDNPNLTATTGSAANDTVPTQNAVVQYVENRYLNKLTGGTVNDDVTFDENIAVDGGSITTINTTFNLIDDNASVVNFAGGATVINIGAPIGTTTINNDAVIDGTLDVTGDTTVVGIVSITIPDETVDSFSIVHGTEEYINISTSDQQEEIAFGQEPKISIANTTQAVSGTIDTGALTVAGGVGIAKNVSIGGDLYFEGTIISTSSGSLSLFNNAAGTVNAFGAATEIEIGSAGIVPGNFTVNNDYIRFSSVYNLKLPTGNIGERGISETGSVRFNTTLGIFEGYDGIAWNGLGGVRDVDGNTFIRPESAPGANENELMFYTDALERMNLSTTRLRVDDTITFVHLEGTTESSSPDSGQLVVEGGVGIEKNLNVRGDIRGYNNALFEGDLTVTGDATFGTFDSVVDSFTVNANSVFNVWDNTVQAFEVLEGANSYFKITTTNGSEEAVFSTPIVKINNNTTSTNSTSGALIVTGGVGIGGSLFVAGGFTVGGSITFGDDVNADTFTVIGDTDFTIPDNNSEAFRIDEGTNNYFNVATTNGSELITFGTTPKILISNTTDSSDKDTGALVVDGGVGIELNAYVGVDLFVGRNTVLTGDLAVNGADLTTTATTFNLLDTNATTINFAGAATTIDIGAATGTLTVNNEITNFNSIKAIKLPVGTTDQRPTSATGQVRFNTDLDQFEGYDGIAWNSLGGVRDVDGNTYIIPESAPGANENTLMFYTDGVMRMSLSTTDLDIHSSVDVTVNSTTGSTSSTTGSVVIDGGVGIAENLYVGGRIGGDIQIGETVSNTLTIRSGTVLAPDSLRLITNAPDSAADDIVYPIILAHHSISGTPVIGSGTGIKFELETQNDNFEVGGIIDVVALDVTGTQEDFDMVFRTMNAGATASEKFRLSETVATLATDLAVNGDVLSTTQTTFNLLNTDATTINFAGAATVIAIGATGGLTTFDQNVTVNEDLTVDGSLILTNNDLEVQYGGTGVSTFTTNGILYGDSTDPLQVTDAAGTSDATTSYQILTVTSDVDATPVWTDTIDGGSF